MQTNFLFIVLLAVLRSIIGSLIRIIKKPSEKFMYNMLAFAGGVMLAISFLQLIPQSIKLTSEFVVIGGILFGAVFMFLLDKSISQIHPGLCSQEQGHRLNRTAIYLLIGIFMHNFPEGMAMAIGAVSGIKSSVVLALAIAIHNIPEGICTSAPYFYYTKKKIKIFFSFFINSNPYFSRFFNCQLALCIHSKFFNWL